ncbi:hypothetical protein PNW85_19220 [[Ruminococcus] gnavus]|uniref:Uncharacterized protein n=1 Tax=Mediterraneibacter gnavus TaxID=33038 RepID=A0AAW6DQ45_MEDGN|nr:hypothetical protein [Mediterraneibacter gnavus]MDB8688734.1 hypothetical protein [Mediterraneibacter gnavus]
MSIFIKFCMTFRKWNLREMILSGTWMKTGYERGNQPKDGRGAKQLSG